MQWTAGQYAGFSEVKPWNVLDSRYPTYNVASETNDPNSLLTHYRTLISLRNNHPALRTGELFLLSTFNEGLFACLRTTTAESVLVIVNLTNAPIRDYQLSLDSSSLAQGEYTPVSLMNEIPLATLTVRDNGHIFYYIPLPEIPPYATIMMQLQLK